MKAIIKKLTVEENGVKTADITFESFCTVLNNADNEIILEIIKNNHTELKSLGERNAFCRGFSLAVRLMVEAMSSEKT